MRRNLSSSAGSMSGNKAWAASSARLPMPLAPSALIFSAVSRPCNPFGVVPSRMEVPPTTWRRLAFTAPTVTEVAGVMCSASVLSDISLGPPPPVAPASVRAEAPSAAASLAAALARWRLQDDRAAMSRAMRSSKSAALLTPAKYRLTPAVSIKAPVQTSNWNTRGGAPLSQRSDALFALTDHSPNWSVSSRTTLKVALHRVNSSSLRPPRLILAATPNSSAASPIVASKVRACSEHARNSAGFSTPSGPTSTVTMASPVLLYSGGMVTTWPRTVSSRGLPASFSLGASTFTPSTTEWRSGIWKRPSGAGLS
mmetsp:Transcript_35528/g.70468  ORF Transcript_35528/g.70468 Transcript_35528/m.70468 type:complete len:312 (-) Transcript_35528:401-1336(-)